MVKVNDAVESSCCPSPYLSQGVLNMMGNEVVRYLANYRKNLICDVVSVTSLLAELLDVLITILEYTIACLNLVCHYIIMWVNSFVKSWV